MNHDDWEKEIRALEEEGCRAFLARDLDRLEATWSDELLVNSPINRVHDKRQVLDLLRAGTIAHASLESRIETIRRHGDLVVVMGSDLVTNSPGGPEIRRRFTNLWRREGASWRLFVRHANIVAESPGALPSAAGVSSRREE